MKKENTHTRFTAAEIDAVRAAHGRGTLRAIDARSDGRADCDALQDGRSVGERIADGFKILNGVTE